MTRTRTSLALFALLISLLAVPLTSRAESPARPHIVLIVADDLGWGDVGYHDSEIATPMLDRLAARGAELDRFYANPTCSPTRASLLTGEWAIRLGVLRPLSKNAPRGLPLDRRTLAQHLKTAGYQTALVGKWHLGYLERAYNPNARGFDSYYGHVTGGIGYWDHVHGGGYDWQRDGATLREDGYTTHLIAAEAERVISERDPEKPLFLMVAFNAPHLPNEAPPDALARAAHIADPRRRAHAAMIGEMDRGIGGIVGALEREGMADDTIVWFMSDNGGLNPDTVPRPYVRIVETAKRWLGEPLPTRILRFMQMNVEEGGADNAPFRMGKQSIYEGGVRVPALAVWPGRIPAARVTQRVTVADVMPTLLEAAGVPADAAAHSDGAPRLDLLEGNDSPAPAPDFVTIAQDGTAFYRGDWKLIALASGGTELYDLAADPTESTDLAGSEGARVAEFSEALAAVPRGEDVGLPLWRIIWDPDEFGGEERGPPMAERVSD
jgi:arylsulfatase A-like enzyme